jgi:hypothetical protein
VGAGVGRHRICVLRDRCKDGRQLPLRVQPSRGEAADGVLRQVRRSDPERQARLANDEEGGNGAVTTVTFAERDGKTLLTVTDTTGAPDMSDEQFAQLDALLAK